MDINNNCVLLNDIRKNLITGGSKQKTPNRFENLGIPVGFFVKSTKPIHRKQPTTDGVNEPVVTDKLLNYFITRVLP